MSGTFACVMCGRPVIVPDDYRPITATYQPEPGLTVVRKHYLHALCEDDLRAVLNERLREPTGMDGEQ